MSSSGLPSTATRSAARPAAIDPVTASSPIDLAASDVMAMMASIGACPDLTRSIASRAFWPCAPATASVPITIFSPGVLSAAENIASLNPSAFSIAVKPSSV